MDELTSILQNRIGMYRLLGQIYRREVTPEFLSGLTGMILPAEVENDILRQGFSQLADFLKNPGHDAVTNLAVDYARVFLGAGIADGTVAYPYESVYTSPEGLIKQEAWEKVFNEFRAHGLAKADGDIEEDHIALELEFMAILTEEAMKAHAENKKEKFHAILNEQKRFLHEHLLNWTPKFLEDVRACAGTEFYPAVAQITQGYLAIDQGLLEELTAQAL